ncbi:MAG: hypothetical protein FWE74_06955 [Oscillospiraceae bacterium]|nr:hypothetical protein [Oscillospiraceae bacterium]
MNINMFDDEMAQAIMQDIESALPVLESVTGSSVTDTELFTTTVHGMKSALMNIGEAELSDIARRLEEAGESGDMDFINSETPGFINALKTLTCKYKKEEPDYLPEVSGEDMIYLYEKLGEIKTACGIYNKKAAKAALTELKQKRWTRAVSIMLDEITRCLLHGEFKKITAVINNQVLL